MKDKHVEFYLNNDLIYTSEKEVSGNDIYLYMTVKEEGNAFEEITWVRKKILIGYKRVMEMTSIRNKQ